MSENLERAEVTCRQIGEMLQRAMPEGWGFSLIVFSYGETGSMTHISSAPREDLINLLREMADKLEKGEPQL